MHTSCIELENLFIFKHSPKRQETTVKHVISCIHSWHCDTDKFSPGSVTLTFLWPHLFQVTFNLTQVLDFGLQGFNLNTAGTIAHKAELHTTSY